jgi:hypothetical protein
MVEPSLSAAKRYDGHGVIERTIGMVKYITRISRVECFGEFKVRTQSRKDSIVQF